MGRDRILAALPGLGVLLGHAWWFRAFVIDDAYITFRYARNLAAGLGPVFNPGERVEGFSNPLLTFLLGAVAAVGRDPAVLPAVARGLGVACAAGAVLLVARLPLRGGAPAAALAALAVGASSSFALWSVAGLETVPYALLLLAGVALSLAPPRGAAGQVAHGLVLAGIALSRPEGIVPAAALALAFARDGRGARDARGARLRTLVAAALPVIAYVVFRRAWFGAWLPNTWAAKHQPLALALPRGLAYLGGFLWADARGLFFLPALLALRGRARGPAAGRAGLVLAAYLPTVVFVGGDWMDQHRFVAPVVPLLAILAAEGWAALAARARGAAPAVAAVALAALLVPEGITSVRERGRYWVNAAPYYTTMGRVVRAVSDPRWSVATVDVGAIGWHGGIRVLDLLGLVNPAIARHETWDAALVAAEMPELLVLHYDDRPAPPERWRPLRLSHFDAAWERPAAPFAVPGALRVRADVRDSVEARLRRLPPALRADLAVVDAMLARRQPDGLPLGAAPAAH